MYIRLFVLFVCGAVVCQAQQNTKTQMPKFESPPGYTTTVQSMTRTFNFYPLTPTLLLPWDRLQLQKSAYPPGVSTTATFSSPSKKVTNLYNNPAGTFPEFGTPDKMAFQVFNGPKGAGGTIIYMEFKKKLPANSKEIISRYLFGSATPPDPNTSTKMEQFLVNNHTLIVWCFKDRTSIVKQDHQQMIFDLMSEVGQKK